MRRIKAAIALWAVLTLSASLPGIARAQAQPAPANAAAPQTAPEPLVHARPALWVVKDRDTTIYLFGTIHLMKPHISWFEGKVRKAYGRSGEVVMEVVEEEGPDSGGKMLAHALNPNGPTVTSLLPEDMREKYRQSLTANAMPPAIFDRMKPWFVSVTLSLLPLQRMGYDPAQGVDMRIKAAARKDGKTLTGLETADQQLGYFDSLTLAQQTELLVQTLKEQDQAAETIEKMVRAWSAGDPVVLADTINESLEETPDIAKILLFDRNARWAEWIKARLARPGKVFVAVGAGHLAGKGSVQDELAKRGIATTLVKGR